MWSVSNRYGANVPRNTAELSPHKWRADMGHGNPERSYGDLSMQCTSSNSTPIDDGGPDEEWLSPPKSVRKLPFTKRELTLQMIQLASHP